MPTRIRPVGRREHVAPLCTGVAGRAATGGDGVDEAVMQDGVPVTAGWFVINARDARWMHNDMRAVCKFGGEGLAHFDDLGIGLYWIEPGRPMTLYHHEPVQEDFLVLRGHCILDIEGEERTPQCATARASPRRPPRGITTPRSAPRDRARRPRSLTAGRGWPGDDPERDRARRRGPLVRRAPRQRIGPGGLDPSKPPGESGKWGHTRPTRGTK
jgi:hypothetical protein